MTERRLSITEFMTDGVLAQLCGALGDAVGARGSLRDADGALIEHTSGDPPWAARVDEDAERVRGAIQGGVQSGGLLVEPLEVRGRRIGAIALQYGDSRASDSVRAIVCQIAATVGEFCEQEEQLRERNAELEMLFRLSGMLVEAKDIDSVLRVALRFAMQLCGGDAGLVHLLEEKGTILELRAHEGVSEHFARELSRLPAEQVADRDALRGGVRCVGDLIAEGRALHLDEIGREGLVGMVSSGLVFNGKPLGIVRVYTKTRATLEPTIRATLQTVLEQAAAAVASQRLRETEREHRQVQRQLRLASEVQRRMLPAKLPSIPGFDLGARYQSSFELGGDFYDLLDLNGHLGVLIGDVVGKGLAAALLMSSVRATFRAHARERYHLDEVMRLANEALAQDTLVNEFATVFFGVVDPASRRLTFASAGHEPPIAAHRIEDGGVEIEYVEGSGLVIGVDASHRYERHIRYVRPGEIILTYTDGVIDAMNFDGERFGRERLRQAVRDTLANKADATAQDVVDHVFWEVRRFVGLNPPTDDITLVAFGADG